MLSASVVALAQAATRPTSRSNMPALAFTVASRFALMHSLLLSGRLVGAVAGDEHRMVQRACALQVFVGGWVVD